MIKKDKDLLRAAKTMYRFQEDCKHRYFCTGCAAYNGKTCRLKAGKQGVPAGWDITPAALERLEAECNELATMYTRKAPERK